MSRDLSRPQPVSAMAFAEDVRDAAVRQLTVNRFYRSVCERQGWSLEQWDGDPGTLPFITASTFKSSLRADRLLINVPVAELACWMVSSETTGEVSLVGRTSNDIRFMQAAYADQTSSGLKAAGVQHLYGFNPTTELLRQITVRSVGRELKGKPVIPQALVATEAIGNMFRGLECLLGIRQDGSLSYDPLYLERVLQQAEAAAQPIALGGSPQLLYGQLKTWKKEGARFNLPSSWIITGQGGWSGRKARFVKIGDVDKWAYLELIQEVLEIAPSRVRDMYGLTEIPCLCEGHWSNECSDFVYQAPPWARVYVVGTNLRAVALGEVGLLKVVVPYGIEGYPGLCILTDDLVRRVGEQSFLYLKRSEGQWNALCGPQPEAIMTESNRSNRPICVEE